MKNSDAPERDLARHLQRLKALRGSGTNPPPRLAELKRWQSERLAASYADLSAQPRYGDATRFFLEDLYGPKDFSERDEELIRIMPAMSRILPASAVETAALAIELEALSESLDHRVAAALAGGPIDDAAYSRAYRAGSTRPERERQIELIDAVGRSLDSLVHKPLVSKALRVMRGPAHLAGLGDLQEFLERGFSAFRSMDGAAEFLDTLAQREKSILNRLFSGDPKPFSV